MHIMHYFIYDTIFANKFNLNNLKKFTTKTLYVVIICSMISAK